MKFSSLRIAFVFVLILMIAAPAMTFAAVPMDATRYDNIFIGAAAFLISQVSIYDFYAAYDLLDPAAGNNNQTISINGHIVIPRLSDGD